MKKILRIFIVAFLILNIPIRYVHSETLNLIEEELENVGVPEEYSDNIINYITNLKLSEEETKNLLDEANDVISRLKEKEDYSDFTFTELLNIYDEALNIADTLNINFDLDLSTKEVVLKDKDSKLILIKCNIDDAKRYYENYKESHLTYQDYEELKSYIAENTITNEASINNGDSNNNSDSIAENDDYNNGNNNLNDEEIVKNSHVSDNSYNSTENNNETLNSVSAIKRKNINRVLSIIFLVLFVCVVVSLLIDLIFFNREK
ncbi:hypothetical protein [Clostridium sp. D43t1_170807_H7]|uniref:hypothetical protein n=1 Tax=Clostridium sp. D43t1_170807_H7 TaxID=2787140 RepID=UPI0018992563|nr:hypothetical protein [Clostridium sp. D43t1_170807_H7]